MGILYSYSNYLPFMFMVFILSMYLIVETKSDSENKTHNFNKNHNNYIFYLLNILMIITLIILNQTQITYAVYLETFSKFSVTDISFLFAISGIIIVIFQIPIGCLFDKLSYAMGCFYGTIFLSFGIGIISIISSYNIAIISCTLWTFGEMICIQLFRHIYYRLVNINR